MNKTFKTSLNKLLTALMIAFVIGFVAGGFIGTYFGRLTMIDGLSRTTTVVYGNGGNTDE